MLKVKIGGVPEHFNLPWYIALKEGLFKSKGINLRWHDCYGGTGEMCQALRNKDIDLAVILTEGIIKDIIDGNDSKIIQTYVSSPLIWGIHVASNSPYTKLNELKGKKAAISREGSGSHLMAYVNAENLGWDLNQDLKFEIVESLQGGIHALSNQQADYFLWENFTTKPFVDSGVFRKIGECPTPWPCFVIAASNNFINQHKTTLSSIIEIINSVTKTFKSIPDIDKTLSKRYEQQIEDVRLWLQLTEWAQKKPSLTTIDKVQKQLTKLQIIEAPIDYNELVIDL
jgi:ABC-type nitrate/sulfonate/bicarbonate transport system substrate-binding protein